MLPRTRLLYYISIKHSPTGLFSRPRTTSCMNPRDDLAAAWPDGTLSAYFLDIASEQAERVIPGFSRLFPCIFPDHSENACAARHCLKKLFSRLGKKHASTAQNSGERPWNRPRRIGSEKHSVNVIIRHLLAFCLLQETENVLFSIHRSGAQRNEATTHYRARL